MENVKKHADNVLEDATLLEENRNTLNEFFDFMATRSAHTRRPYAYRLRKYEKFIRKPFKEATKADITAFLGSIGNYRKRTLNGYITYLRAFYRWLYKMPQHKFPECVEWLEKYNVEPVIKSRHELITKDEFKRLLNSTESPQIKCYLVMSLEGLYHRDELRL